jgi:integrase
MKLTDRFLESIKATGKDQRFPDDGERGAGRLYFRVTQGGTKTWQYRYTAEGRKQVALALGGYDRKGENGLSLTQARSRAAELSRCYQSGIRDLKEHLEAKQETIKAEREAAKAAAAEVEARARRGSLKALLDLYLDNMEAQGKKSAGQTRSRLTRHVLTAWPQLVARPADEITPGEIADILRKMVNAGITRETNLVRAGLHAAYQLAMKAQHDPTITGDMGHFMLQSNPVAGVPVVSKFNKARDRVLNWDELAAYLRRVEELNNPITRDALLLALYAGGQRIEQTIQLALRDIDSDAGTITLFDPKGRRQQPRVHVLPLTDPMQEIITRRREQAVGEWLFSNNGKVPMRIETPSHAVTDICRAMLEAGEAAEQFQMSDIRRTCETKLAEMGVSLDLRAQIQSHGLSGVQARHYDRHSYLPEKRRVLEAWAMKLGGLDGGNVVALKGRA